MNEIRLTADLRRDGFSYDDIARICRDGTLARVRRGASSRSSKERSRRIDICEW